MEMSHVEPEHNRPHETEYSDPAIKYSKCPTCGFATIYKGQGAAQDAPRIVDEGEVIMFRARAALKRLGGLDRESHLICEAIDDWMLLR
jgi:hypothetical protein